MSIDPRYLEELLRLRFLDKTGLLSGSSSSVSSAPGSEFYDLLDSLLQTGTAESVSSAQASPPNYQAAGAEGVYYRNYRPLHITDYEQIITDASSRYGVDANLIRAVIQTESGFKADAVSKAGAKGLMQLMDDTAEGLGVRNSFDPEQNILGGTKFLGYLLQKYGGKEEIALAAYNAGPGRVDRLGIGSREQFAARFGDLPHETQRYVSKVLATRDALL